MQLKDALEKLSKEGDIAWIKVSGDDGNLEQLKASIRQNPTLFGVRITPSLVPMRTTIDSIFPFQIASVATLAIENGFVIEEAFAGFVPQRRQVLILLGPKSPGRWP